MLLLNEVDCFLLTDEGTTSFLFRIVKIFFCFSATHLYGSPNLQSDPHNPISSIYLGSGRFAIRSLAIFKQVLNDAAIKATYSSGKLPIMW